MGRRYERIRLRNASIALAARRHRFGRDAPVPFLCECDDDACRELVPLALHDYDGVRDRGLHLVACGHPIEGALDLPGGDGYELRLVRGGYAARFSTTA